MTSTHDEELLRELLQVIAKHAQRPKPIESESVKTASREMPGWEVGQITLMIGEQNFYLAKVENEIGTLVHVLREPIEQCHAILFTQYDHMQIKDSLQKGRVVFLPHGIASNDLRVKIEIPRGRKA